MAPFHIRSGKPLHEITGATWSQVIADYLYRIMAEDVNVVAITPAMISGSKLEKIFHDFPNRAFDVGIAKNMQLLLRRAWLWQEKKPFLTMYSSFLQRAYDQINHDLARMDLGVVLGSIAPGWSGQTVRHIMEFLTRVSSNLSRIWSSLHLLRAKEAGWYLKQAFQKENGIHCIRYSKHIACDHLPFTRPAYPGQWQVMTDRHASNLLITYGYMVEEAVAFVETNDLDMDVVNARYLKPLDQPFLKAGLSKP